MGRSEFKKTIGVHKDLYIKSMILDELAKFYQRERSVVQFEYEASTITLHTNIVSAFYY